MASEYNNNSPYQEETENMINLQDIFYICLARWKWFVVSVTICLAVAVFKILTTEPIYTRTTSILVKDNSNGKSMPGSMNDFSDLGMFSMTTNVNNELGTLKSPDLMREVVSRLHLEMTYKVPERFYKKTIYGSTLPVEVQFMDLTYNESLQCELEQKENGQVSIFNFILNGKPIEGEINGKLNDTILSPVGKVVVIPTNIDTIYSKIYVFKSPIHATVDRYANKFEVTRMDKQSNILTLTFNDVSIQRAEEILFTYIAVYNESWIQDKNQIAVSTSMFINERLGLIENELSSVDDNISSYKSDNLLPDIKTAAQLYITQASEADALIRGLNTQVYMARYIRDYLSNDKNQYQMIPTNTGIEGNTVSSQISEYNKLLLERNSLIANSSTKNPLVLQINESMEYMRGALLTSIDNELVALNAQIKSLQNYGGYATSQIASNPKQAKYLLGVERQQKVKESLYLYLLQKREENELNQAFTAYNTRIIIMPTGSMFPTEPQSKMMLLIALVIGLAIPVGIIFLQESTNTVIRGKADLEKLSLPIIAEVPQFNKTKKRLFKKHQTDEEAIVVKSGSRNIINEAFRILRTNLEFMSDDNRKQNVFVVTSFNTGSGKSFITMNTSVSLALKNEKSVLVIDGDMRHASASAYIGFPKPGLSDYLSGKVQDVAEIIIRNDKHPFLSVIPVGTIPPNPTELLCSEKLKQLIGNLKEQFDYILIDCPPIEIVADTQIIEKLADRTIFIVRAGLLEKNMLPVLEKYYTDKKFKNMAVILNGTESGSGYRYGYRYGYHNGYGAEYNYGGNEAED